MDDLISRQEEKSMTYVRRYSYRNHCYEKPEELPKNWHTPLVADSMDEIINCTCCGKELRFGNSLTSMIICSMSGSFGFPVCEECYQKEWNDLSALQTGSTLQK